MTIDPMRLPERAIRTVECIVRDLNTRSGLQNAWDDIDEDTQGEIMVEWVAIILRELGPV
jgi:hypothetical protein